jgi:hypothetical protein
MEEREWDKSQGSITGITNPPFGGFVMPDQGGYNKYYKCTKWWICNTYQGGDTVKPEKSLIASSPLHDCLLRDDGRTSDPGGDSEKADEEADRKATLAKP